MNRVICGLCVICGLFSLSPLAAEAISFTAEIERLERLAENPAERFQALAQMARLHQLSGNREKALELWTSASSAASSAASGAASSAVPGTSRDDKIYLEAIKLMIAMGEFEKAGEELRTILMSNRNQDIQLSAWYINAQLELFRSGNREHLIQLSGIPQYSDVHSKINYTLFRVSGDTTYRTRLISMHPRSVEAGIVSDNPGINAAFTPQWLLFPPREELTIAAAPTAAGTQASSAQTTPAATPAPSAQASPQPAPAVQTASAAAAQPASGVMLQTGLFSREDNAKALSDRLSSAGFSPVITRRSLSNGEFWAVNVPAGNDTNQTIARLRSAGFDAFPVQ